MSRVRALHRPLILSMATVERVIATPPERQKARERLSPLKFGFKEYGNGWEKEIPGRGTMVIAPLSWEHAQAPATLANGQKGNVLELIGEFQKDVWGMGDADIVPTNVLSIVRDTGASVLVAYMKDQGVTQEGILGFALGLGGSKGTLISHMVGVEKNVRGAADIGWHLKLIQAYDALNTHDRMQWTYDPMRGANAKLNLEKLGGIVDDFTINKYGRVKSELYGEAPTDRFTVTWDLLSDQTHQRMQDVYEGKYKGLNLADIQELPLVTAENVRAVVDDNVETVVYEIPADANQLSQEQELTWRRKMRQVFRTLLNTDEAIIPQDRPTDVARSSIMSTRGAYSVTHFATGHSSPTERKNYYVLKRK